MTSAKDDPEVEIVEDRHLTREDLAQDKARSLPKIARVLESPALAAPRPAQVFCPSPAQVFCGVDLWTTAVKCCPDCTHGTGKGERCEGCGAWGVA